MIPILKISCNVLKKVNLAHRKQWLFDCDHFDDKNVYVRFIEQLKLLSQYMVRDHYTSQRIRRVLGLGEHIKCDSRTIERGVNARLF